MDNGENIQEFFARMADVVSRRYDLHSDKSLRDVYLLNSGFLDTRSDAGFAFHNREKILAVLADEKRFERLVDLFIHRSIEFTYASNQFVQIDSLEESELRRIYADYLSKIKGILLKSHTEKEISRRLSALVKDHFLDLRTNLSRFFDPETSKDVQHNAILQKVVCSEYSAEMQLEILGMQLETLVEPVLDLGCGKSGRLVRHLSQKGIQVTGVDRIVDSFPDLIQGDWLDYPLETGFWGTIVSHMAFTNHFLFHYLYRHGSIEHYARRYMAILNALRPEGSFYYAPGLPFIETYLPEEKYLLTQKQIVENLYACRVIRKAQSE